MAKVEPGRLAMACSMPAKVWQGWIEPTRAPCARAASSDCTVLAPLQCTTVWPGRQLSSELTFGMKSSAVVTNTMSTASASSWLTPKARHPGTSAANRSAAAGLMSATAATAYPCSESRTPNVVPTGPAPINPSFIAAPWRINGRPSTGRPQPDCMQRLYLNIFPIALP